MAVLYFRNKISALVILKNEINHLKAVFKTNLVFGGYVDCLVM